MELKIPAGMTNEQIAACLFSSALASLRNHSGEKEKQSEEISDSFIKTFELSAVIMHIMKDDIKQNLIADLIEKCERIYRESEEAVRKSEMSIFDSQMKEAFYEMVKNKCEN